MRKAVIFDLYETLITENHPEWHAEAPAPGPRLGIPQGDFAREWAARYQARMTGELRDYSSVLREISAACGVAPPAAEIAAMQAEREAAKDRPFARIDPQVVGMLDRLRAADYRTGLITNCTHDEILAWDASPLAARMDAPVFSCREGLTKPDAAIYALACARLGVEPGAAIFVGDGGSDELRGAEAAGLKAVWATWFIDAWPWDWAGRVAATADAFPRCREPAALPALADGLLA